MNKRIKDFFWYVVGLLLLALISGMKIAIGPLVRQSFKIYPLQTHSIFVGIVALIILLICLYMIRGDISKTRRKVLSAMSAISGLGLAFCICLFFIAPKPVSDFDVAKESLGPIVAERRMEIYDSLTISGYTLGRFSDFNEILNEESGRQDVYLYCTTFGLGVGSYEDFCKQMGL